MKEYYTGRLLSEQPKYRFWGSMNTILVVCICSVLIVATAERLAAKVIPEFHSKVVQYLTIV